MAYLLCRLPIHKGCHKYILHLNLNKFTSILSTFFFLDGLLHSEFGTNVPFIISKLALNRLRFGTTVWRGGKIISLGFVSSWWTNQGCWYFGVSYIETSLMSDNGVVSCLTFVSSMYMLKIFLGFTH